MCDIVTFMQFILLCCPEGTYVKEGERLISFKRERDSRCPSVVVAPEKSATNVEEVVVGGVITVLSVLLWVYIVYKVYKMCQRRRE